MSRETQRVVLIRSNPVLPDPPVEKMASTLISAGYSVTVLAWDRGEQYKQKTDILKLAAGDVPIVRFGIKAGFGSGKKNLPALLKFELRLRRWLIKNKKSYDIIHAFDFDTGLVAQRCAKRFSKKLVYHILDYYCACHILKPDFVKTAVEKAEIGVINKADATIICSEKRREQISKSSPKRLYVIHNTPQESAGIDKDFVLQGSGADKLKIAYVGILAGSRFIKEIAQKVCEDKRFEFHIGGFGALENTFSELSKNHDNIFYYGRLEYSKTLALEKACDIMTAIYDPRVPNHKYAAPNKFYESLMLSKPVIMARGTGFDDIIEQSKIGRLMEYSTEELNEALEWLYQNKDSLSEMGARARELYESLYRWDIMDSRIKELYSSF